MEVEPFRVQRCVLGLPFLAFVDDVLGDAEAENRGRHAGVEQELDEYSLDLPGRDADGEAGADLVLHAEVVTVDALGGDGGETAQLEIEAVRQPDAAPHEFVLHPHEIGQNRRGSSVGQVLVEELPQPGRPFLNFRNRRHADTS